MNKILATLGLLTAIALPALAEAREVTITTELNAYRGDGAYLAIYVTDAAGKYQRTLHVAGGKSKYYKHLLDWARGSGGKASEYDGMTGASVSSGDTLTIKVDVDDALIDAGYLVRVDSAVEDQREHRIDAEAPLTTAGSGQAVVGKGYVKSLTVTL